MISVFLSHDVDWRKQGAPLEHIYARKDRFDEEILKNSDKCNPYYNLPEYMDIEDKFGIKSTFFFRTEYENGNLVDYEDDLKTLSNGGWEIGLHTSPVSIDSLEMIAFQKKSLEELANVTIYGNRVHYLGFNQHFLSKLKNLEFVYDSTIKHYKDKINEEDMGYLLVEGLVEFPITLMDTYLFTYNKLKEEQVTDVIKNTMEKCKKIEENGIFTIIWHDCSLKMKGGRIYPKILEFLSGQDDVKFCRGIDLANSIIKDKNLYKGHDIKSN